MTDDELPPLPEIHSAIPTIDAVGLFAYIRAYARNYARLAIEQDRARDKEQP